MKRGGIGDVRLVGVLRVLAAGFFLGGVALFMPSDSGPTNFDFINIAAWILAAACAIASMFVADGSSRS